MNFQQISIHKKLVIEIEYLEIQIIREILKILYREKPYIDYINDNQIRDEDGHKYDNLINKVENDYYKYDLKSKILLQKKL